MSEELLDFTTLIYNAMDELEQEYADEERKYHEQKTKAAKEYYSALSFENPDDCFSKRLKMIKGNTTIKEISDATGLSRQTIDSYLNGKKEAKGSNLIKLADYFGCSVDYLLGRANNESYFFEDEQWLKKYGLSKEAFVCLAHLTEQPDDRSTLTNHALLQESALLDMILKNEKFSTLYQYLEKWFRYALAERFFNTTWNSLLNAFNEHEAYYAEQLDDSTKYMMKSDCEFILRDLMKKIVKLIDIPFDTSMLSPDELPEKIASLWRLNQAELIAGFDKMISDLVEENTDSFNAKLIPEISDYFEYHLRRNEDDEQDISISDNVFNADDHSFEKCETIEYAVDSVLITKDTLVSIFYNYNSDIWCYDDPKEIPYVIQILKRMIYFCKKM